jgi:hypothetical protein
MTSRIPIIPLSVLASVFLDAAVFSPPEVISDYFEYFAIVGFAALVSQTSLIALWVAFGRTPLALRLAFSAVAFVLLCAIVDRGRLFQGDNAGLKSATLCGIHVALAALFAMVIWFSEWRLLVVDATATDPHEQPAGWQWSLHTLFAGTTLLALCIALAQHVEWYWINPVWHTCIEPFALSTEFDWPLIIHPYASVGPAVCAMAGMLIVLGRHSVASRTMWLASAAAFVDVLFAAAANQPIPCPLMASKVLHVMMICATLSLCRRAGYRLEWHRRAHGTAARRLSLRAIAPIQPLGET